jgi:hypothetical protein
MTPSGLFIRNRLGMKRSLLSFRFFPLALFLLFLLLLLAAKANVLSAPYHWDVMGYVMPSAQAFFDTGQLSSLTGISGHPPLFFVLLAVFWKVFGQSIVVSHALVLIFGALCLTASFVLTEKLYSWKEAVGVVTLLFFNQLFFAQVGTVYLSVPLMCLAVISLHFYLRQKLWLYLISASAMLMIKETSVVVLLAVILFEIFQRLFQRISWKAALKRLLILSLPLCSLVLWSFYHWQKAGWFINKDLIVNKDRLLNLFQVNFARHLIFDWTGENVNRANWVVFLVLIVFIVSQAAKRKSLRTEWLLLLIVVLNILFFSYTDDLPRYFLVIYPFFYILGARAFVVLFAKWKSKNIVSSALILAFVILSVFNYWGKRTTDGWRLESNMEYLDLVRVCRSASSFIESGYGEHKIVTTFPLNFALLNPRYGYVSEPLSLISLEMVDSFEDVLVVRTYQANYLYFNRFLKAQRSRLKKIAEFSRRGKRVVVFEKRKGQNGSLRTEGSSTPG